VPGRKSGRSTSERPRGEAVMQIPKGASGRRRLTRSGRVTPGDQCVSEPRPLYWCKSREPSPGVAGAGRPLLRRQSLQWVGRPASLVRVPPQTRRTMPTTNSGASALALLLDGSTAQGRQGGN
jgi:hypothetical protein